MEVRDGNSWRKRRARIVCGPLLITSMDRAYNKDTTTNGDFGVENDDDFLPSRAGGLRGSCSSVYNIERLRVARWWHWVIVLMFAPTLGGVRFSGGCWVARGPLSPSVKLLTYRYCCSMKRRRSNSSSSSRSGDNVKTLAMVSQSLHYPTAAFDAFDTLSPGSEKGEDMKGGNGNNCKRLLGETRVCRTPSTNKAIIEDTTAEFFL